MSQFIKIITATLFSVSFVSLANAADFQVEPVFGYMLSGSLEADSVNIDADTSAMSLGVKGSYIMDAWNFGFEYGMLLNGEIDDSTTGTDDATGSRMGLFAGYKFTDVCRAGFTYYLNYNHTIEYAAGDADADGSGFGLSGGYSPMENLWVDLQYHTYSGDDVNGATIDFDGSAIYLSAGYTFDFAM